MYCLSLTYPNLKNATKDFPQITKGVDILELRADLLEDHSIENIKEQIKILKENTKLPILFTIRSKREGGNFENNETEIFKILKLAIKLECEYIDTEIHWSKLNIRNLIKNKRKSKIIASFHNFEKTFTKQGLRHVARRCLYTNADIIKIVMTAEKLEDNLRIFELIDFIKRKYKKPIISMCMGEQGKLSRSLNVQLGGFCTMVTHPLLPSKAAGGQISVAEIEQIKSNL